MENTNRNLLSEKISDETIVDVYKGALKKNGVSVRKMKIEHDKENKTDYFHIITSFGIDYWIKWSSSVSAAYIVSKVGKKESPIEIVYNPGVQTVVGAISADYKKFIKRQGFLKQLLSLLFEGDSK